MNILCFLLFISFLSPLTAWAQKNEGETTAKNGIPHQVNFGFTMQNRFDYDTYQPDSYAYSFYTRRLQLKSNGFIGNERLHYKLMLNFTKSGNNGISNASYSNVLQDAVIYYQFSKHFELGFGATKLPTHRQYLTSGGAQQFVDRSVLHSYHGFGRDQGLFFNYKRNELSIPIRLNVAITNGLIRKSVINNSRPAFSGRFEALPLGLFKEKGDYFEGDYAYEETPKLALAIAYSNNINVIYSGTVGNPEHFEIATIYADFHFKYKGWALLGEYSYRPSNDNPSILGFMYEGWAFNSQLSYQNRNHHEIAFRWARFTPSDETETIADQEDFFTIAYSKYFLKQHVKFQVDYSYQTNRSTIFYFPSTYTHITRSYNLFRVQLQVGF